MANYSLDEVLHPKSIAVCGASPRSWNPNFVESLLGLGFKGPIYPINPNYQEMNGLKCYPNIKEIPGPVDYAVCSIGARAVTGMLDDCAQKGVKVVHIFTGRFGETGRPEEAALEQDVLRHAQKGGIRLIGPNCMGLYDPKQGIGWSLDFSTEPGPVGMASQSSYGAHDFILMAMPRGIRFSKVIGFGNALDFNESDYLDYLVRDPDTKIILMYVEGVKDGKRFLDALRRAASTKPVIIIKGGRSEAGARAAASHTAALAGSADIWKTAFAQTGAIPVESFEQMSDLAVSFRFLPRITRNRVGIAVSGGGPGVVAADLCEEAGLKVVPLPAEMREDLKSKDIPIWDWIGNPVDMSMTGGAVEEGDMLQAMAADRNFDLLIALMGEPHHKNHRQGLTADDFLAQFRVADGYEKPFLAVVPDKGTGFDDYQDPYCRLFSETRKKLIASNIPVYPTIEGAARSVAKLIDYYRRASQENLIRTGWTGA